MWHIGAHSATFELCKIAGMVADDSRTLASLPGPRAAQRSLGVYSDFRRTVYIPFAFATWACGSQGIGLYIWLHCFNRLEMVFPDLSAHAGPVTLRRVIPVDATEKQKAIKC